ncbi:hypothetical protein [Pseudomonas fulva]|nr:hypothetical protein [Pseudomonas fulva]MBF8781490.1 hypothetical protein [Pseudomonas fulva]
MKIDPAISAKLAVLQPNQIGLLAWSLLAQPQGSVQAGGIPGQPDPDFPQPSEPETPPEGVPTIPDEPPPTPQA